MQSITSKSVHTSPSTPAVLVLAPKPLTLQHIEILNQLISEPKKVENSSLVELADIVGQNPDWMKQNEKLTKYFFNTLCLFYVKSSAEQSTQIEGIVRQHLLRVNNYLPNDIQVSASSNFCMNTSLLSLTCQSSYFKSLICPSFTEGQTLVQGYLTGDSSPLIELENISPLVLKAFLQFTRYEDKGALAALNFDSKVELFQFAHFSGVTTLVNELGERFEHSLQAQSGFSEQSLSKLYICANAARLFKISELCVEHLLNKMTVDVAFTFLEKERKGRQLLGYEFLAEGDVSHTLKKLLMKHVEKWIGTLSNSKDILHELEQEDQVKKENLIKKILPFTKHKLSKQEIEAQTCLKRLYHIAKKEGIFYVKNSCLNQLKLDELNWVLKNLLPCAVELNLSCHSMKSTQELRLDYAESLKTLILWGCTNLTSIASLKNQHELEALDVRECPSLETLFGIDRLKRLKDLQYSKTMSIPTEELEAFKLGKPFNYQLSDFK